MILLVRPACLSTYIFDRADKKAPVAPIARKVREKKAPVVKPETEKKAPVARKVREKKAPVVKPVKEKKAPVVKPVKEKKAPVVRKVREKKAPAVKPETDAAVKPETDAVSDKEKSYLERRNARLGEGAFTDKEYYDFKLAEAINENNVDEAAVALTLLYAAEEEEKEEKLWHERRKRVVEENARKALKEIKRKNTSKVVGTVLSVKDAVAFIDGLPNIRVGELVEFINKDLYGMALNLENSRVGVIIFGDDTKIKQGDFATTKEKLVSVSVSTDILGRVVDALGEPIDGKAKMETTKVFNIERKAPGVITRKSVTRPLLTGYKIIDSMLPIGRGQRELILGDRQTGKTTIGIDTILNQKYLNEENIDVNCIYVGIGQKKSSILNLQTLLESKNAMFYTILLLQRPHKVHPYNLLRHTQDVQ